MPIGVTVVAGKFKDNVCCEVAQELEKKFGGWVPPFETPLSIGSFRRSGSGGIRSVSSPCQKDENCEEKSTSG